MAFHRFPDAADCHFHIMDAAFPTLPNAAVRNLTATTDQFRAFAAERGTTRGVVVQPSLYGTDNRHTLGAVAQLGQGYRAVVVIDDRVTPNDLRALDAGGTRGARFNQIQTGATTIDMMPAVARMIADLGWHVQLHMRATQIAQHEALLADLPVPLVIDHCGRVDPRDPAREGLDAVFRLLDRGRTWIKLSAPYLCSASGAPHFADAVAIARAFADANEDRVVWGSDWPHVTEADDPPEARTLTDFLEASLESDTRLRKALVDNPAALYGFALR
jgi:predicted TIM-barrel fold metal-dependent hydrolase